MATTQVSKRQRVPQPQPQPQPQHAAAWWLVFGVPAVWVNAALRGVALHSAGTGRKTSSDVKRRDIHELQATVVPAPSPEKPPVMRLTSMNLSRTTQVTLDVPLAAAIHAPLHVPLWNVHPVMLVDALASGLAASSSDTFHVLSNTVPGAPHMLSEGLEILTCEGHTRAAVLEGLHARRDAGLATMDAFTRCCVPVFPTSTSVTWSSETIDDVNDEAETASDAAITRWPLACFKHDVDVAVALDCPQMQLLLRADDGDNEHMAELKIMARPGPAQMLAFATPWQQRLGTGNSSGSSLRAEFQTRPLCLARAIDGMARIAAWTEVRVTASGTLQLRTWQATHGLRLVYELRPQALPAEDFA